MPRIGSDAGGDGNVKRFLWAFVAVLPFAARAQIVSGPYVSLGAGVNLHQDEISTGPLGIPANFAAPNGFLYPSTVTTGPAPDPSIAYRYGYQFRPGFAGRASAGYGFGNGLRVEVEGDFLSNRVSGTVGTPVGTVPTGYEQKFGGMVNALFDLDVGLPVFPYVGVGVGGQVEALHDVNALYGTPLSFSPPPQADYHNLNHYQSFGGFAYQGIAGAAWPVPYVPGLSLTAEYRLLGLADRSPTLHGDGLENILVEYPPPIPLVGFKTVRTTALRDFSNSFDHSIMLGVRYAFGQPPAPAVAGAVAAAAPPPMAPVAMRTYLVFFDWDRAELTERARAIVAEAASASTHVQTTRIEVNGYTDLSGGVAYNQKLSLRRARSVQVELVRDGVAAAEISIQGYGEANPLVPTAAGVREPQNRRVEILLR
jgi:outer membrane protein OmpA-like peptidoglycan-associated protein